MSKNGGWGDGVWDTWEEGACPPGEHPPPSSAGHHAPWRPLWWVNLPTSCKEWRSGNVATSCRNDMWQRSYKPPQLWGGEWDGVWWDGVEKDDTDTSDKQHNWTQQCCMEQPGSNEHTAAHHTPLHTPTTEYMQHTFNCQGWSKVFVWTTQTSLDKNYTFTRTHVLCFV